MHFWSHALVLLHGCLILVLKYAVGRFASCLSVIVSAFHITHTLYASHFPRLQRSKFLLHMVSFVLLKTDLFSCYIKQIMNVFPFVQWNKYFHSVKDELFHSTQLTFHLSPHENISTIALNNIHYLYAM